MKRLKISSIVVGFFLLGTTAFLLEAQEAREALKLKSNDEGANELLADCDPFKNTKPGARATLTYKGVEFAFCYCLAGAFTMGSPSSEKGRYDGETQREVKLTKGFWMQETELTQAQWDVLGVSKEGDCRFKGSDLPIENVSWNECDAYVSALNKSGIAPKGIKFSLPTEAQWEYACRAGTKTAYFWGNGLNGDKANCDGSCPCGTTTKGKYLEKTTPVKSYDPNPWGLYDMHGNVLEWCLDWYDDYPKEIDVDPIEPKSAFYRAARGGSWCGDAEFCRSASRYGIDPANRYGSLGFRLVLE